MAAAFSNLIAPPALWLHEYHHDQNEIQHNELAEFKNLIEEKINIARSELHDLAGSLSATNSNSDDAAIAGKTLEDGSATAEKEQINQLAARQKKFITQLEAALQRIQNKTYGICRETGKLIPAKRLRAVPHTTLSMEAKLKQN